MMYSDSWREAARIDEGIVAALGTADSYGSQFITEVHWYFLNVNSKHGEGDVKTHTLYYILLL